MLIHSSRDVGCCYCLILLMLFISCILCFVLLFFTNFHVENITNIKNNFEIEPIFDLQFQTYCPVDYKPIVFDKWLGTVPGCEVYYPHEHIWEIDDNVYIKKGGCADEIFKENERERKIHIPGINAIDITKWRGKQFCSKRRPNPISYSYLLENSVKEGEECKEGYKKCGILDSMNNIACMPKNDMCPINYLVITKNQTAPSECVNCKTIQLDLNYLHYGNENTNSQIITNFRLSDDPTKVCLDQGEYNSKMKTYPLDIIDHYGCKNDFDDVLYDARYTPLDTLPKVTVFEDNGILMKIERLPRFPVESIREQQTTLFKRSYQGFDKQCVQENGINLEQYDILSSRVKTSKWIFVAVLLVMIGNGTYVFIVMKENEMSTGNGKCIAFVCIIALVIAFIGNRFLAGLKGIMNTCGDKYVIAMVKESVDVISRAKSMLIAIIVFNVLSIGFMVFDDIYVCNARKQREEEEEEEKKKKLHQEEENGTELEDKEKEI